MVQAIGKYRTIARAPRQLAGIFSKARRFIVLPYPFKLDNVVVELLNLPFDATFHSDDPGKERD